MRRLIQRVGRCALTILAAACFVAPACLADDDAPGTDDDGAAGGAVVPPEAVVPPGQDALLALMLGGGSALPGGCLFTGGEANGPVIHATYACPTGGVVVEVVHPSTAPEAATQTERFAISVQSGYAPAGLTDVLAAFFHVR